MSVKVQYVAVLFYYDRSGVLQVFGPYPTEGQAAEAVETLETWPAIESGIWEVHPCTGVYGQGSGDHDLFLGERAGAGGEAVGGDVRGGLGEQGVAGGDVAQDGADGGVGVESFAASAGE
jgi:hypothetical protein